ncbi:MAG: T9SS type A sorting domain-containing protein [Fluviicola sp.]
MNLQKTTFIVVGFLCAHFVHGQIQRGQSINGELAADNAGGAVSMPNGTTIAIGARGNDGNGNSSGHVRIYDWNGNSWIQRGQDIDGESASDFSGWSVSMPDENTVAIGARSNNGAGGIDCGHTRIFIWDGMAWIQKGQDIDGEAAFDYSGTAVVMPDNNTVAIGASENDGNGSLSGHVRVFAWNGTAWIQKGLDIDGSATGDYSGVSISMPDANTLAIGSMSNDFNGNNAGEARVFAWNGTAWIIKGTSLYGENASDNFGSAVVMPDANTIAVGADRNDEGGLDAGQAKVFHWNGTAWIQKGNDINGEATEDYLGRTLSMPDSNTLALGSASNDGNGSLAGHVRVFKWNGISWIQEGIDIDGEVAGDGFGGAVSMPTPYTVAAGANFNNLNTGHTRVFDFCAPTFGTDAQTACDSLTWIDGITYTTNNNSAVFTLVNAAGCDSTVTLNLNIVSLNPSITLTGSTLTATPPGADYQWLNCSNNSEILIGETAQNYIPTINGLYSVVITQTGCIDTSDCFLVDFLSVDEINHHTQLINIPNPISLNNVLVFNKVYSSIDYCITDISGRIVLKNKLQNSDKIELEMNFPDGIYYLKIYFDELYNEFKLLKL